MDIVTDGVQVVGLLLSGGCIGFALAMHTIGKKVMQAKSEAWKWETNYYLLRARARIMTGEDIS